MFIKKNIVDDGRDVKETVVDNEPEDVKAERKRTYADRESLLRIYNLKKVYPGEGGAPSHTAVHNLTFSVGAGECFGFLGPSKLQLIIIM